MGNFVFPPIAPVHVAFNNVWRHFPALSQLRRMLLASNEWKTGILNICGIEDALNTMNDAACSCVSWFCHFTVTVTVSVYMCFVLTSFLSLYLFDLEILCYVNMVPCCGVASQQKQ